MDSEEFIRDSDDRRLSFRGPNELLRYCRARMAMKLFPAEAFC
jgi:hypothetical protein